MKNPDVSRWREVQFDPDQWASIPESAGLWPGQPPDDVTDNRLRTAEEIELILKAVMLTALTPRQQQILEMYYLESRTQVEIAAALGITQSTVSQQLKGRHRGRSKIGGAFRKLRKAIHQAAKRRARADTRFIQIIQTLDQLLDKSITHRRARSLLETLARATNDQDKTPTK